MDFVVFPFFPAWQLHIQSPLSSRVTISLLHMSKLSQPSLSNVMLSILLTPTDNLNIFNYGTTTAPFDEYLPLKIRSLFTCRACQCKPLILWGLFIDLLSCISRNSNWRVQQMIFYGFILLHWTWSCSGRLHANGVSHLEDAWFSNIDSNSVHKNYEQNQWQRAVQHPLAMSLIYCLWSKLLQRLYEDRMAPSNGSGSTHRILRLLLQHDSSLHLQCPPSGFRVTTTTGTGHISATAQWSSFMCWTWST